MLDCLCRKGKSQIFPNGKKSEKELDETQGDITFVDEKSMYAYSKRVGFIHFKDPLIKI